MITKIGREWVLFSKSGKKILGRHRKLSDAKAQEHAVNLSKARAAGHHIPYAPRKNR